MNDSHFRLRVTTPREQRSIELDPADAALPLTQVLRHHGLPLNTRCGDRGLCEGCEVTLEAGELIGRDDSTSPAAPGHTVQACRYRLASGRDLALVISERSLARFDAQTVDDFTISLPHAHDPLCLVDHSIAQDSPIGVAVDVGTTTLALMLIDLADGHVIARGGAFNRQIDFGDNVLTRINLCLTDPNTIGQLQDAVVDQTLATLLRDTMEQAGVTPGQIRGIVTAGNATMMHLLCGEDPGSMGIAPFDAVFLDHRVTDASAIGLELEASAADEQPLTPETPVHLLPSASAYVGADIVAGVVASGMRYAPGTTLLIDVGTNGEMVLCHGGELIGCATAAGPAFEGGGLGDGVGAGDGAISHITIDGEGPTFELEVIGDAKPIGICGSAYIDFLAEAYRTGLLNAQGRLNLDAPRVKGELCGRTVVIAHGQGKRPIKITESDVAALLQAKAAIAAGAVTLLEEHGLTTLDIDTVYLAGGFGRHVNIHNAIACGLLPDFSHQQVKPVGNLSLAGAYLALLDRSLLREMSAAADAMRIIELNSKPAFEDHFIDHLTLCTLVH